MTFCLESASVAMSLLCSLFFVLLIIIIIMLYYFSIRFISKLLVVFFPQHRLAILSNADLKKMSPLVKKNILCNSSIQHILPSTQRSIQSVFLPHFRLFPFLFFPKLCEGAFWRECRLAAVTSSFFLRVNRAYIPPQIGGRPSSNRQFIYIISCILNKLCSGW